MADNSFLSFTDFSVNRHRRVEHLNWATIPPYTHAPEKMTMRTLAQYEKTWYMIHGHDGGKAYITPLTPADVTRAFRENKLLLRL
jgi:hypothetical protein